MFPASGSIPRFRSRPRDSGSDPLCVRAGVLMHGIPVRLCRFTQRNTQVLPLLAANRLGEKNQLTNVIRDVRQRPMQRVVHLERLAADSDGLPKVVVRQSVERTEQHIPPAVPCVEQFLTRHRMYRELLVAVPPRFFAIRRQEIGESRSQVAAHVPDDNGGRIRTHRRIPGRELAAQGVSPLTWTFVGVGGVIGFFVVPIIGALAGVVAGAYLGERIRLGSHSSAWASTKRVIISIGKGMAFEFAAGSIAIAIWVGAVLVT